MKSSVGAGCQPSSRVALAWLAGEVNSTSRELCMVIGKSLRSNVAATSDSHAKPYIAAQAVGDGHQLTLAHVALRDDVTLPDPSFYRGQQQRVGDVVDADHFRAHTTDVERHLALSGHLDEHPLARLPIGGSIRVRHVG